MDYFLFVYGLEGHNINDLNPNEAKDWLLSNKEEWLCQCLSDHEFVGFLKLYFSKEELKQLFQTLSTHYFLPVESHHLVQYANLSYAHESDMWCYNNNHRHPLQRPSNILIPEVMLHALTNNQFQERIKKAIVAGYIPHSELWFLRELSKPQLIPYSDRWFQREPLRGQSQFWSIGQKDVSKNNFYGLILSLKNWNTQNHTLQTNMIRSAFQSFFRSSERIGYETLFFPRECWSENTDVSCKQCNGKNWAILSNTWQCKAICDSERCQRVAQKELGLCRFHNETKEEKEVKTEENLDLRFLIYACCKQNKSYKKTSRLLFHIEKEQKTFVELLLQLQKKHISIFLALLHHQDTLSFLTNHLTAENRFHLVSNIYQQVYLPKEVHSWLHQTDLPPSQTDPARFNFGEDVQNTELGVLTDVKRYPDIIEKTPSPSIRNQMIQNLKALITISFYIPELPILLPLLDSSEVEFLLQSSKTNFITEFLYYLHLPRTHPIVYQWVQRHYQEGYFYELFWVPKECISWSLSPPCDSCTGDIISIPPQWRCTIRCEENGKQCSRMSRKPMATCSYHKQSSQIVDIYQYYCPNKMLPNAFSDKLIRGGYALSTFFHIQQEKEMDSNQFTILSIETPPPPDPVPHHMPDRLTIQEFPNEIDTFGLPNLSRCFIYQHLNRYFDKTNQVWKRDRRYVTWIQYKNITTTETLLQTKLALSLFSWDEDVTYDAFLQIGYVKNRFMKEQPDGSWLTNSIIPKQWFYTLRRYIYYAEKWKAEIDILWDKLIKDMLSIFHSNWDAIVSAIIEWNSILRIYKSHAAPLLLCYLPTEGRVWSDVRLFLTSSSSQTGIWRIIGQPPKDLIKEDEWQLSFLPDEKEVFFFGQLQQIEKVFRTPTIFPPKPFDKLPENCYDLMDYDQSTKQINQFIQENKEDRPIVFLKRWNQHIFSSCLTKATLEQMTSNSENWFYECLKEGMLYADPTRTYVKLIVFEGFPSFITLENFRFIMDSNDTYFLMDEHPFHKLLFSTKVSIAEGKEQDITSSDHCQASTDKTIDLFFPIGTLEDVTNAIKRQKT